MGRKKKVLKTAAERTKLAASRIQNQDLSPIESVTVQNDSPVQLTLPGSELFTFGQKKDFVLDGAQRTRILSSQSSGSDATVSISSHRKKSTLEQPAASNGQEKCAPNSRKRKSDEKGERAAKKKRKEVEKVDASTKSTMEKSPTKESKNTEAAKTQPAHPPVTRTSTFVNEESNSSSDKNSGRHQSQENVQTSSKPKSSQLKGSQNQSSSASQNHLSQASEGSSQLTLNDQPAKKKTSRNRTSNYHFQKMDAVVPATQRLNSSLKTKVMKTKVNKVAKSYSILSSFTPDSLPRVRNNIESSSPDEMATPVTTRSKKTVAGENATNAVARTVNRSRIDFGNGTAGGTENQAPASSLPLDVTDAQSTQGIQEFNNVTIKCLLDENLESYTALTNHHPEKTISIHLSQKAGVNYFKRTDGKEDTRVQGIHLHILDVVNGSKICRMRIEPKTCKPLESAPKAMICTVISGSVSVKTAAFNFSHKGEPFLAKVIQPADSSFVIPDGVMYSIENWADEEAKLVIVILP